MISLSGKYAIEIVLGEIDIGANSDIRKVFDRVRKLLDNHVSYNFNLWCHVNETSQRVFDCLYSATASEMSRYYIKTKQMLINYHTKILLKYAPKVDFNQRI